MISPNLPSLLPPSTPQLNHTPDSPILMTITLEPLVRHSTLGGKDVLVTARPTPTLPQTTQTDQPLNSSPAKSTSLLQGFIEAFKEVESYRYVRRNQRLCSGTC